MKEVKGLSKKQQTQTTTVWRLPEGRRVRVEGGGRRQGGITGVERDLTLRGECTSSVQMRFYRVVHLTQVWFY